MNKNINVRDYSILNAKQSRYNIKHNIKIIEDKINYIEKFALFRE